jgi:hypothetical protein
MAALFSVMCLYILLNLFSKQMKRKTQISVKMVLNDTALQQGTVL